MPTDQQHLPPPNVIVPSHLRHVDLIMHGRHVTPRMPNANDAPRTCPDWKNISDPTDVAVERLATVGIMGPNLEPLKPSDHHSIAVLKRSLRVALKLGPHYAESRSNSRCNFSSLRTKYGVQPSE